LRTARSRRVEWPTLVVAVVIAAGFTAVLAWHGRLPLGLVIAALAMIGAWYNSLQHEVVHGHPTPWPGFNSALAVIPLGLVVSFATYRSSHLAHHRTPELTDPDLDPESFYVTARTWERYGRVRRAALVAMQTLGGRLLFGPLVAALRWMRIELAAARSRRGAARLLGHAVGVAVVLAAVRASGMAWWVYAIGVGWGGGALTMLRSFAEHRYADGAARTAVVRTGRFFSLLFLNNNLHHTHHERPAVAWFELPALHERLDSDRIAAQGAGLYRGYTDVARRHLFRPFDVAAHPKLTALRHPSGHHDDEPGRPGAPVATVPSDIDTVS
jgi:fatty acid desaturase